jgi:hypothetical protein
MKYIKLFEQYLNDNKVLYHGSPKSNIKEFKSNFDGIWFTDNIEVAEQVSGVKGLNKIEYSEEIINILNSDMDLKSMFNELRKHGFIIERKRRDNKYGESEYYISITDNKGNIYEVSEYIRAVSLKNELIRNGKNYAVNLKIENPLIIDCKNSNWDNIILNGEKTNTMNISLYAKENGYDSVIFKNLYEYYIKSNVYVVYDSDQIEILN